MKNIPIHTPTPWKKLHLTIKAECNGIAVADVRGPDRRSRGKEWQEDYDYCHGNAEFIVKAVNSHETLVAALRTLMTDGAVDVFSVAYDALSATGEL